jgi:hypothetical protein
MTSIHTNHSFTLEDMSGGPARRGDLGRPQQELHGRGAGTASSATSSASKSPTLLPVGSHSRSGRSPSGPTGWASTLACSARAELLRATAAPRPGGG